MTDSTPLPALGLAFKPDAAEAQRRLRAYWQGEIIDRACVGVRARRTASIRLAGRSLSPRISTCLERSTSSRRGRRRCSSAASRCPP